MKSAGNVLQIIAMGLCILVAVGIADPVFAENDNSALRVIPENLVKERSQLPKVVPTKPEKSKKKTHLSDKDTLNLRYHKIRIEEGAIKEKIIPHQYGFALRYTNNEGFSMPDVVPVYHKESVGYLVEGIQASDQKVSDIFYGRAKLEPIFNKDVILKITDSPNGKSISIYKKIGSRPHETLDVIQVFHELYLGVFQMRLSLSLEYIDAERDWELAKKGMEDKMRKCRIHNPNNKQHYLACMKAP